MLAIDLTINILWIIPAVVAAALAGFLIRASQLGSLKDRIAEQEREIMSSHAEILELHREKAMMEQKLQQTTIPVIPISAGKEDKNSGPVPDPGLHKKVAGDQAIQKKS